MQNLFEDLKELLAQDERLTTEDGKLLKNIVIELGLKLDADLLRLLLSHDRIRCHFFAQVDGILVFDKDKFLQFVSNKQFLPDSYTAFKNKIGLSDDGGRSYLSRRREVALVWPYKDCVLEGGQTKEDAKRDEVFWNTTLAPDDVDRLLDPKVLTNFRRVDAEGEHPVTALQPTDNLIIKGNNLLALHSLRRRFGGQVKLIYIDPPYNTGGDDFLYNDKFNHSTWMTFVKNRLEISKEFLTSDGVIFISCDDNEQAYLRVLCDEIFGRDNFIACLPTVMNLKGNNDEFGFAGTHEYTLVFAKSKNDAKLYEFDLDKEELQEWDEDEIGYFKRGANLKSTGGNAPREKRPNLFYPLRVDAQSGYVTSVTDEEFERLYDKETKAFDDDYLRTLVAKYEAKGYTVLLPVTDGKFMSWRWERKKIMREPHNIITVVSDNGSVNIYKKQRPSLGELPSRKPKTLFYKPEYSSGNATAQIKEFFGSKVFKNPKPLELIKDFVIVGSDQSSIILDFTGGSGTTAHAVLDLNKEDGGKRQFIILEQMDYIETITAQRIRKVMERNGEGDFIYCELMQWNERYVQRIQAAGSDEELWALWQEMQEQAFLSYKVDVAAVNEHAEDFADLTLEEQKRFLLEILDHNALYVNFSEIDDADYAVSEEDKRLNAQFYGQEE